MLTNTVSQVEHKLNHNGPLQLAFGSNRFETKWKNRQLSWSQLVGKLATTSRTGETRAEYPENKVIDLPVKMLANAVRLQFEGECDDKLAAPIYFSGFAAALRMLGKDALADEILGAAAAEKLL